METWRFATRIGVWVAFALVMGSRAQADKIDDFVQAEMQKKGVPGVALAVVRNGKVVKSKGYGSANVEHRVPVTPKTAFQLASVTKQFTATAILMLAQEGKLTLEDKVATHLTDLPSAWKDVTIRHLLNHTSGIKSYTNLPTFFSTLRKDYKKDEIIALVRDAPLEFTPGEKFRYNNTGYFLLGMVIEKISGKSYGEFLKERLFDPLGMKATQVNTMRDIILNRAQGYANSGRLLINGEYVSPTQPYAAGALISTLEDMVKWDAALETERLLKKSALESMWTPLLFNDGSTYEYGFGWATGTLRGHRWAAHGGGIDGFSTFIIRFLNDKLTVIVLTNHENGMAQPLANGVAERALPALAPPPAPTTKPAAKP